MNLKLPLNHKSSKSLANFSFLRIFVQLWIFTPTTNIWDVNSKLFYDTMLIIDKHFWAPQDHWWSQSLKLCFPNFVVFRQILQKNTELQLQFSQWRKKIFDFSGRFSESSNKLSFTALQPFSLNLIAFRRKISPKQWGFLKLASQFFAFLMTSSRRQYGRFPTFHIVNKLVQSMISKTFGRTIS
jgi:hypothetical protein